MNQQQQRPWKKSNQPLTFDGVEIVDEPKSRTGTVPRPAEGYMDQQSINKLLGDMDQPIATRRRRKADAPRSFQPSARAAQAAEAEQRPASKPAPETSKDRAIKTEVASVRPGAYDEEIIEEYDEVDEVYEEEQQSQDEYEVQTPQPQPQHRSQPHIVEAPRRRVVRRSVIENNGPAVRPSAPRSMQRFDNGTPRKWRPIDKFLMIFGSLALFCLLIVIGVCMLLASHDAAITSQARQVYEAQHTITGDFKHGTRETITATVQNHQLIIVDIPANDPTKARVLKADLRDSGVFHADEITSQDVVVIPQMVNGKPAILVETNDSQDSTILRYTLVDDGANGFKFSGSSQSQQGGK